MLWTYIGLFSYLWGTVSPVLVVIVIFTSYTILISVLRECWFCDIPAESVVSTPGIVDCDYSMGFWVGWEGTTLTIGQGPVPTINQILSWTMVEGYIIRYIGLNTANGATGTWILPERKKLSFVDVFYPRRMHV